MKTSERELRVTTDNRTYKILFKRRRQGCFICCRRVGLFLEHTACWGNIGRKLAGEKKNWKHYRKKQWRE